MNDDTMKTLAALEKRLEEEAGYETEEVIALDEALTEWRKGSKSGTYECFHCGTRSVIWDSDFSFEDYCEEGEGIIHECHCANCGARITYFIQTGTGEEAAE